MQCREFVRRMDIEAAIVAAPTNRFATHGVCTARQTLIADPMERHGVTHSVHHARRKKLSRHGALARGEIVNCEVEETLIHRGGRWPRRLNCVTQRQNRSGCVNIDWAL